MLIHKIPIAYFVLLVHFLHLRTQSCRETPITQQTMMTIIAPISIFA